MAERPRRIFHIAKELNISHTEIIAFLNEEGITVGSHMAPIDDKDYHKILTEFSKDKESIERYRKEQMRKEIHDTRFRDIQKSAKKINLLSLSEQRKLETEEKSKAKKELEKEKAKKKADVAQRKVAANAVEKKAVPAQKEAPSESGKEEQPKKADQEKSKNETIQKEVQPPLKKVKLRKINLTDIESEIGKGIKRTRPPIKDSKAGTPEKSVEERVRQTLAKIDTKAKKKTYKKGKEIPDEVEDVSSKKVIAVPEYASIDELAKYFEVTPSEIIQKCLGLGVLATINQRLDWDMIELLAEEHNCVVEKLMEYGDELFSLEDTEEDLSKAKPRAPVITVMGHVDHGKTSLLDYIRDENVVAGESGGITQHIGAYEVRLDSGKKITFLDTPGHAAFTAMRARGAQVTDIVIVIIAADDGVMSQTKEAIDHAKAAEVPIIIAINKVDVPNANPDKIRKSLGELNILVEEWGGKYQCQEISAKNGQGIDGLLDKILLEAEVLELKANQKTEAKGIVIESRLDKGLGAVATVVINKGTLTKGEIFVCGNQFGKVRAMMNERGQKLTEAFPSDPVQILGFDDVPKAGDTFTVFKDEREAKKIATERAQLSREAEHRRFRKITLDQIGKKISSGEVQELDIIIKGDVDGSIEAVSDSLMELSTDEVSVKIIHRSVGMITESDVSLAAASSAIIIAFNVKSSPEAKAMAKSIGVDIRNYSIIYEAIQEVKLALEGLLEPEEVEKALGYADVREQFKIPKLGIIAGCYIKEGRVVRNALLRVKRDGETLHTGKLTSLKRFKDDVADVTEGYECGIGVDGFKDFNEGDVIEVYEIKEVKRSLA